MKIVALVGSLRQDSYSKSLAEAAKTLITEGSELILSTPLDKIPNYNEDLEDTLPEAVANLRTELYSADALLIVTPEYNAGPPGLLKNAIDWASRPHGSSPLQGLPTAVVSNSPMPFGGLWAKESIIKSLGITGTPVSGEISIGKINEKLKGNTLTDKDTESELQDILSSLISFSSRNKRELSLA